MEGEFRLEEVLNAAMAVAKGDFATWKDHAAQAFRRMGQRTSSEIVKLLTSNIYAASQHSGVEFKQLWDEVVPFYHALAVWARDGYPAFSLSPDFFTAIACTDFGDPTEEPLYMPFEAFVVTFPKSRQFDDASRLFVYQIPAVDVDGKGELHVRWLLNRTTLLTEDPIFTQWPIGFTRKQLVAEAAMLNNKVGVGYREIDDRAQTMLARARMLLSNTLSYVEAAGPLPASQPAKRATPSPVERLHPTKAVFQVGRPVRLDGGMRRALEASGDDAQKWQLAQRFIVRGHWRNQVYGEGRALRRRQWIAPFWKGPENVVEALSRTYDVV